MKLHTLAYAACLALLLSSCARPTAKFSMLPAKDIVPAKVTFTNLTENADAYLWDFGDGQTSTEASPTHTYLLSGKHTVKLTATKGGKSKTVSQDIVLKAPKECYVFMETSEGDMMIHLYDETQQHRDNFVKLAESDFYNGLLFHRVIDGFMIQGGDPNSKGAKANQRLGSGGPGYTIPAEFNTEFAHVRGALSAARQGDAVNPEKRSSGSQFYIVHGKPVDEAMLDNLAARIGQQYPDEVRAAYLKNGGTPFLDQNYTVFGMVVDGLEVIDRIAKVRTDGADRPKKDVKINKVTVVK